MDSKENKEIEDRTKEIIDRSEIEINLGPAAPNLIISTKVGNGHLVLHVDSGQVRYFQ
jgi:hypothetical protein